MTISSVAGKSADAFRTISEVAEALKLPQHVLRFWETRFTQIKPLKRAGGRRFYRPEDVELLGAIRQLLYGEGYTIKGVQRILREQGPRAVAALARHHKDGPAMPAAPGPQAGMHPDLDPEPAPPPPLAVSATMAPEAVRPRDADAPLPWLAEAVKAGPSAEAAAALRAVLDEIETCRRLLASALA